MGAADVSKPRTDTDLINWLQCRGATVAREDTYPLSRSYFPHFVVTWTNGTIHHHNLRAAINAAMDAEESIG